MSSFTNALLLLALSYMALAQIQVGTTQETGQYPIGSLVTTTFTGASPPSIIQLCQSINAYTFNPVLTISSNAASSPVTWTVPSPPLVNCVDQYLVVIHDANGFIGESTPFTFSGCPSNTTAASSTCPTPTTPPASTLTLTSTKTVSTCSASTLTTTASVTEVVTVTSTVAETGRFRDTVTETITDTERDKVTSTITEVVTDFQRQHTTVTEWITDTRFQFTTVTVVETATATRRPQPFAV